MALQDYITAYHRASVGAKPDREFVDFLSAFKNDPALVTEARAERDRLDNLGNNPSIQLFQRDHESKMKFRALVNMLASFDSQGS